MEALSEALATAGFDNVCYETKGIPYEWLTWRRCLYEFAPHAFRGIFILSVFRPFFISVQLLKLEKVVSCYFSNHYKKKCLFSI